MSHLGNNGSVKRLPVPALEDEDNTGSGTTESAAGFLHDQEIRLKSESWRGGVGREEGSTAWRGASASPNAVPSSILEVPYARKKIIFGKNAEPL